MGFKTMRKRAGRGLQETADYIGVSKQAVNLWERNINEPSIGTIKKLAEFYNCTLEELLTRDDDEADKEADADAEAETDEASL